MPQKAAFFYRGGEKCGLKVLTDKIEPVFNIHVADNHTYFVGDADSQTSALVHNDSGKVDWHWYKPWTWLKPAGDWIGEHGWNWLYETGNQVVGAGSNLTSALEAAPGEINAWTVADIQKEIDKATTKYGAGSKQGEELEKLLEERKKGLKRRQPP